MPKQDYDQQVIIELRPGDHFVVMQNGKEKRMLAQGFLDFMNTTYADINVMSGYATTAAMNAAIANFVTSTQMNTAIANFITSTQMNTAIMNFVTSSTVSSMITSALTNYITASQLASALAGYQPYVAPSAAIAALPASVVTLSILGIGLAVNGASGQQDRDAINAILVALRAHGIILP